MVFDSLCRSEIYSPLHPLFKGAFALADELIRKDAAVGRYEGENGVYAMISEYAPSLTDAPLYEAHREYIDIQIVMSGREQILVCDSSDAVCEKQYTPDAEFFKNPKFFECVRMAEGRFLILFPSDLHAPGIALDRCTEGVKKLVVKVPVTV